MKVPMSSPSITEAEIKSVNDVLHTGRLALGPQTELFENKVASYVGAKHGIAVNSGTSGLHLAVIAAGIEEGDEVITTSFSFIASANSILYERGIPVFVDIDPQTGNIDPNLIEAAITKKTKAILVVDAFGQPADLDPIVDIANRHNLRIIHDTCESIGAEYKGRRTGRDADVAVFAFYPNKQLTTGEGGMIVTSHDDWANLFRSLRNQGRDLFNEWLNHDRLGYNYRMDEMSAALGAVQIDRIDELLNKRAQVAHWYDDSLVNIEGIRSPFLSPNTTRMSWFVYVVRCDDDVNRDALLHYLRKNDIPSRPYFTPIHLQSFYINKFGYKRGDLPLTEYAGDTFLALPFSSEITQQQVEIVTDALTLGIKQISTLVS